MKKLTALILALALSLALSGTVLASSGAKSMEISYSGITIAYNGVTLVPMDVKGNPVEPFASNGTTYLPLRAVAGALGLGVEWDGAAKTVKLTTGGTADPGTGTPPSTNAAMTVTVTYSDIKITLDGAAVTPKDVKGNPVEPFAYNGTTYLPVRAIASALGIDVEWDQATKTVYLGEKPAETCYLLEKEQYYDENGSLSYEYTYKYDGKGQMIQSSYNEIGSDIGDYTETIAYNSNGQAVSSTFSDGDHLAYTYDAAGKLTGITGVMSGEAYTEKYAYDAKGNCVRDEYTSGSGSLICTSTYDEYGNTKRIVASYKEGVDSYEMVVDSVYTYDKNGNILTETDATTIYDITATTLYSNTYDERGNLTVTYEYDVGEDGAKTYSNATYYTYDKNGLLIKVAGDYGYTVYTYAEITL